MLYGGGAQIEESLNLMKMLSYKMHKHSIKNRKKMLCVFSSCRQLPNTTNELLYTTSASKYFMPASANFYPNGNAHILPLVFFTSQEISSSLVVII